jgi:hypothetical protein
MKTIEYMRSIALAVARRDVSPGIPISTFKAFQYIQKALDSKGVTTKIVSRRERTKPRWIYTYDVHVNFEIILNAKTRNRAKLKIFDLFKHHCPEVYESAIRSIPKS